MAIKKSEGVNFSSPHPNAKLKQAHNNIRECQKLIALIRKEIQLQKRISAVNSKLPAHLQAEGQLSFETSIATVKEKILGGGHGK
jgi:hypothetical protein